MSEFRYKAVATNGKTLSGCISGESAQAITQALEEQGILVTSIRRQERTIRSRVRAADLMLLARELSALLRAGIALPTALELASRRQGQGGVSHALQSVHADVQSGIAPGEAFARRSDIFDSMWISAMRIGERNATLPETLDRYFTYQQRRIALHRKLGQAATYPVILLVSTFVIVALLLGYSLPRFERLYSDLGTALPLPTRVVMEVASYLPLFAVFALVVAIVFALIFRRDQHRLRLHGWLLKLPVFGLVQQSGQLAQLYRSLAILLGGGTTLVQALTVTAETLGNRHMGRAWTVIGEKVSNGTSIAAALQVSEARMPETDLKIIEAGEQAGELETQFGILADYHEELLDAHIARLTALLEPLLMLFIGLLIGAVVIALYLPIFSIAGVIA